jgi:hypothetical protein
MTLDARPQKLGILAAIGQTLRSVRRMGWPQQRQLSIQKKLAFALIANILAFTLLTIAGEILVRVRRGGLAHFGKVDSRWDFAHRAMMPVVYDPELGYVPRANARSPIAQIDSEGLRTNGNPGAPPGPPILAVGDSFTFGDEVDDSQTWPAYLERLLSRRVLNAGVNGYGLDQIVMRAESLVPKYRPAALVVAIIGDDVKRCRYSRRGTWKPYFTVESGELRLHNVPVPPPAPPVSPSVLREILRYSFVADSLMSRLAHEWWGNGEGPIQVHRDDVEVSILLMERLQALQRRTGVSILFLVEHAGKNELDVRRVTARARELRLEVLDLSDPLFALMRQTPSTSEPLFLGGGHLSSRGNKWIADQIAKKLYQMGIVRELDGDP